MIVKGKESTIRRRLRPFLSKKKLPDTIILFAVLGFSAAIAASRYILVSQAHSLEWDSGSFLTNGGVYAGYSQYSQSYDPTRPPFVPFLISLAFRLTMPNVADGYAISAALYFCGIIATFLVARRIMNPLLAGLAAGSFALAPKVFEWSGIAVSDVEGVAVGMMALSALIYACEKSTKLLLVALPLMVLTPLTRYSMASVFIAALVYLAASRNLGRLLDHFEFYYGFGLSILAFVLSGIQWISYPFVNHFGLLILFPSPNVVNPFHTNLGKSFYLVNFSSVLGVGAYGTILSVVFLISSSYALLALVPSSPLKQKAHPLVYAMISWFAVMFAYYSLVWPYDDPRYSIEFLAPAMLVTFWGFSQLSHAIYSARRRIPFRTLGFATSLLLIITISAPLAFAAAQSGTIVYENTPPLEGALNAGLRQATTWLYANVPLSAKMESNWYTLMWWYAPEYNFTPAPLAYQIGSQASYIAWFQQIVKNRISYIVYVDPSQIRIPAGFTEVFRSTVGNVVVYRMAFS